MKNDLVAKLLWRISQDADLVANNPDVRALNTQMKNVKDSSRLVVSDGSNSSETAAYWIKKLHNTEGELNGLKEDSAIKITKLETRIQTLESQKARLKAEIIGWKMHWFDYGRAAFADNWEIRQRQIEERAAEWEEFLAKSVKAEKWEKLQALLSDASN